MKSIGIQVVDHADHGEILDLKINPVRDSQGKISSGLLIGNILEQNKAFILMAQQGELKSTPKIGVSFGDITLGSDLLPYRHKIREHFLMDGLKVQELILYENKPIKIIADYETGYK